MKPDLEDVVSRPTEMVKNLISVIDREIVDQLYPPYVKDQLIYLRRDLTDILPLMEFAIQRQDLFEAPYVRFRMSSLRDVIYEADDVLDDLLRREIPIFFHDGVFEFILLIVTYKVSDLLLCFKMAYKLRSVHKNLYRFRLYSKSGFPFLLIEERVNNREQISIRLTNSNFHDSRLVGMEDHKVKIVSMLLLLTDDDDDDDDDDITSSSSSFAVIPIVGMGGIGKTTLAQLVYNDDSVQKHFEVRIWLRVSNNDDFDVKRLLIDMIESITKRKCDDDISDHVGVLVDRIQEQLRGKKYLLVLDDLWIDNVEIWESIKSFLSIGASGSKILVTTRTNRVASIVGGTIIPPYNLQGLSVDHCWSIIRQIAFPPGGPSETPNLVEIGKDIARKCHGSPFVARCLGGVLLRYWGDESEWTSVNKKELLDMSAYRERIIPVMKLSYNNLPTHLKTCFSYLSIFPPDQKISRESLFQFWMAEGIIQPSSSEETKSMEDIGDEYFNLLCEYSVFHDVERDERGVFQNCRMHALLHDLARVVGGCVCSVLESSDKENTSEVRRVFRTVIGIQGSNCKENTDIFSHKHMRVLKLRNYHHIGKLSRHLKYLDLSRCQCILSVRSISTLYNLQTLILHGSSFHGELSIDIGSLKNMRHLDLSCTKITFPPDSIISLHNLQKLILHDCQLHQLASRFGELEHLSHLDVSSTEIKELPDSFTSLCNLKTFNFASCRYLEALPKNFGSLTNLTSIDLSGTRIKELPDDSVSRCMSNLEKLNLAHCKLPTNIGNLIKLKHLRYEGERYETPTGIGQLTRLQTLPQFVVRKDTESRYSNITDLKDLNLLEGEIKICNLENARGEEDAKEANLKGKQNIQCLDLHWSTTRPGGSNQCSYNDDEAVLDALKPHRNLKTLKIKNFKGSKLPAWMSDSLSSCLPSLVELDLLDCSYCQIQFPVLGQLKNLKVLFIHGMNSVEGLGDILDGGQSSSEKSIPQTTLSSLSEVSSTEITEEDQNVPMPSSFPCLEKLTIAHCHKLKEIQTPFPSLKELDLLSCHGLKALHDTEYLTSLEKLTIRDCKQLALSPADLKRIFKTAFLDIDTPISPF